MQLNTLLSWKMGIPESNSFFLFFLSLFSISCIATSTETCLTSVCGKSGPAIRFPFRITGRQPERCGYPGFNLSCNNRGKTILKLPSFSEEFNVEFIDYRKKEILINGPDDCLPRQLLLQLNLSGSPFNRDYYDNLTFLNCSSSEFTRSRFRFRPIACLSSSTHKVLAISEKSLDGFLTRPPCSVIATVRVPIRRWVYGPDLLSALNVGLVLRWDAPKCRRCEARGERCGFKSNTSLETGCFGVSRRGFPRSARYALSIGAGIPALVCLMGIVCFVCGRIKAYRSCRRSADEPFSFSSTVNPPPTVIMGLDGPTIESYPKLVLGESRRLPKPNDSTCPICMSQYRPKETLRTLPVCQHCFHVDCIDEWLRLNATCPVCRNFPGRPPVHD